MFDLLDDDNVTDHHPENPWGARQVWHYHGAVAIGQCRAFVEATPAASIDDYWLKAGTVAAQVFDVHFDTGDPVSDSGFLAAIDAAMVPMLFGYMVALREQLRYKRFWAEAVRRRDDSDGPDGSEATP